MEKEVFCGARLFQWRLIFQCCMVPISPKRGEKILGSNVVIAIDYSPLVLRLVLLGH